MAFSMLDCIGRVPLAFVDVETTGASSQWGDRVIEIGIVRVEDGAVVSQYEQLIDPQRRIGAGITALTGITPEMCVGKPTFAQQMPAMMPLLQGAVVLGHNVRFDLSFLCGEFRRARRDIVDDLQSAPVADTVRIARRLYGRGGNGLQMLSRRLGIVPSTAHRALADAQTTHRVFEQMLTPHGCWKLTLCDLYMHQGGPMGLRAATPRESVLPFELEEALERRKPVQMDYLDARDKRTQRCIVPLEIRRYKGKLMLVAHCQLRNDRRTFSLDRIVELRRLETVHVDVSTSQVDVSTSVEEGCDIEAAGQANMPAGHAQPT